MTGVRGRLGSAVVAALGAAGLPVAMWTRPDYDLDDPRAAERLIARDHPSIVVNPAAWTDVDGCARDPDLAVRRNGTAVAELATAAARQGIGLVHISTNEVFDGQRSDGRGYAEEDDVSPANPYGASKLAGEQHAQRAYDGAGRPDLLWIVRTAWLYGPPGADFPAKIVAAADRLVSADEPLRVVDDEIGSPTHARELAQAIVQLLSAAPGGLYHIAARGIASRFDVAQRVLARCRPGTRIVPISRTEFVRASSPPPWSVLDSSRASSFGIRLRPWQEALDEYVEDMCGPSGASRDGGQSPT